MKIEDVKRNLNKMVVYKGVPNVYKLRACIIRREKEGFFYQAELLDAKQGHSVVICKLDDIEVEKC